MEKSSGMKFITLLLCVTAGLLATAEIVWCHGVLGRTVSGKGILIEAEYDDGEPMSYASIEIFDSQEKLPFQSGRTDRNGRFLFYPDEIGVWKIVVKDGMGHRLVLKANSDKILNPKTTNEQQTKEISEKALSRHEKALMGISIIFGISGVFFWWKGRRMYSRNKG